MTEDRSPSSTARAAGWLAIWVIWLGPASAQDEALRQPFSVLDRNKNKVIDAEEFPGDRALFKAIDRNRDRVVSFDEYKVSALARRYLVARRVNRGEPRPRVGVTELAVRRLRQLTRFDQNRDGKVTRKEWTGAPGAFTSLDVDGNGVIDKSDRRRAEAEAAALAVSLRELPKVRSRLPAADRLFARFDKDKDSQISASEAKRSPLARFFRYADQSGDDSLDRREVTRLCAQITAIIARRDLGYARPRAPTIPFKAWDKNKDGRVDLKEWIEKKYLFKQVDRNRDAAVTELEMLRYKRAFEGRDFLEKFDLNGDQTVSREEFGGSAAAFRRADRNGDGVISNRDR